VRAVSASLIQGKLTPTLILPPQGGGDLRKDGLDESSPYVRKNKR
jgi:hypothetical protein